MSEHVPTIDQVRIGDASIKLMQGDITQVEVDAVVTSLLYCVSLDQHGRVRVSY